MVGVAERAAYINRIRTLARACCLAYQKQREEMGHPLLAGK